MEEDRKVAQTPWWLTAILYTLPALSPITSDCTGSNVLEEEQGQTDQMSLPLTADSQLCDLWQHISPIRVVGSGGLYSCRFNHNNTVVKTRYSLVSFPGRDPTQPGNEARYYPSTTHGNIPGSYQPSHSIRSTAVTLHHSDVIMRLSTWHT